MKHLENFEELFQTIADLESHNPDTFISTYAGDVKQLFTELPHEEIIKSMEWAIQMLKKTKSGRCKDSVTINLSDKTGSRIGPNYNDSNIVKVSFEDMLHIAIFDMKHAFFKINEKILRQVFGIPQGSPLSPALSQCVLMYYEHQFMMSIHDHRYFMGIRYIDDVRLIVISPSKRSSDIQKAEELTTAFINNLPESLVLEPEPNENNGFRFLESYITFNDRAIKIAYYSKNFHYGNVFPKDLDTYPFQTYSGSYMKNPEQEIKNNIRTRLEAIENYSENENSIHLAMISSLGDFYWSRFPKKIVMQALYNFVYKITNRKLQWENTYYFYEENYPENPLSN